MGLRKNQNLKIENEVNNEEKRGIYIRFDPEQKELIDLAAKTRYLATSQFIRQVLLEKAHEILDPKE